ncbi:MAG: hypothetical protein AAF597_06695 [Bacteroidota bacterium]
MIRFTIALLAFAALFTACGGDTGGAANTLEATVAKAEKDMGYTNSGPFCLSEAGKSLCDYLEPGLLEKYLPAGAEFGGYKPEGRGMLSSCSVTIAHPSKTMTIGGGAMKMEVPAEYTVTLGSVSTYDEDITPKERFEREYRIISPEEADRLRQQLADAMQQKVKDGEMTQEQADMSSGFGKAIGKSIWEPVSGVGDLAVWGNALPDTDPPTSGTMVVLVGSTQFQLTVDLLESKDNSKAAAMELAKAVIAACE